MARVLTYIRRTLWLALEHDVFNTAKAAAYSGMLCFFPAVLVLSGETQSDDVAGSPFQPAATFAHLGALADWLSAQTAVAAQPEPIGAP